MQSRVHDCMVHLMCCACEPFFECLRRWIYRGILRPQDEEEFFIAKSSPSKAGSVVDAPNNHTTTTVDDALAFDYINASAFWEHRYIIVHSQLPGFLASHAEKILKTGKYLNVVQGCGKYSDLAPNHPNGVNFI